MGTYTTNYNLFMPSVGEQGWGELVNGNFTTIDTTMGGLNTRMGTAETNITSLTSRMGTAETSIASNKSRIGTLETETDAMKEKLDAIDVVDGAIEGEFSGNLDGCLYVNASTTASSTIGSYTITPSSASVSSSHYFKAGASYNTSAITINDISIVKKKGFEFNSPCPVTISLGINSSITKTNLRFTLYRNGTQFYSGTSPTSVSTTLDDVSIGDKFYGNAYVPSSDYETTRTLTLTLSGLSGSYYLA